MYIYHIYISNICIYFYLNINIHSILVICCLTSLSPKQCFGKFDVLSRIMKRISAVHLVSHMPFVKFTPKRFA